MARSESRASAGNEHIAATERLRLGVRRCPDLTERGAQ
jgi:hypothetical protein